jgi:hypothetical protein
MKQLLAHRCGWTSSNRCARAGSRSTRLVFGGIVALLFVFGLTESRVLGFIGLSRLLVTYIQLTMAILPIFVLITTVRSVAGDREAGVFEYLLSLPVSLSAWFWGKILGRYLIVFAPVFLAMLGARRLGGWFKDIEVPWGMFGYYTALLAVMDLVFPRHRHADLGPGAFHRCGAGRRLHGLAVPAAVPRPDPARRDDPGHRSPRRWPSASPWPTRCRSSAPPRWRCSTRN